MVPHGTIGIMGSQKKNTRATGDVGEQIALQYLVSKGHSLISKNYWKKWGEIDLITKRENVVHFIEVKTVSYETKEMLEKAVTHETWRPEELVHQFKLHQIEKALETWISEHTFEGEWKIDVVAVRIVPCETYATVNYIENVVQ